MVDFVSPLSVQPAAPVIRLQMVILSIHTILYFGHHIRGGSCALKLLYCRDCTARHDGMKMMKMMMDMVQMLVYIPQNTGRFRQAYKQYRAAFSVRRTTICLRHTRACVV